MEDRKFSIAILTEGQIPCFSAAGLIAASVVLRSLAGGCLTRRRTW